MTVIVTIDGMEREVGAGTVILDAARKAGIKIPTFCAYSGLTPLASCRMCLVEIEGQHKLQPSCATPVADGMVVNTASDAVKQARSAVLEFYLGNHPLDCPVCDKGGECELQDAVMAHGPRSSVFGERKRTFHSRDRQLNAVIIANANRCVQCMRCVRVCDEVVGAHALGAIGRGSNTVETGFMDDLSDCDHCGNCIDVCPVGALMSFPYRYRARPWDLEETETVCPHCGTGCRLTTSSRDGKLMRVRARLGGGFNEELLCARGRFGLDVADAPGRIDTPLLRRDGHLVKVSWPEAWRYIATRWVAVQERGKQMGGLVSAQSTNETLYGFQKLMRTVFKTNHIDSYAHWARPSEGRRSPYEAINAIARFVYCRMPLTALLDCDTVLVFSDNVPEENPISDYLLRTTRTNRGFDLYVIGARPSRIDTEAKGFARFLPGQQSALVASLMAALFDNHPACREAFPDTAKRLAAFDRQALGLSTPQCEFLDELAGVVERSGKITLLPGSDLLRSPDAANTLAWLTDLRTVLSLLDKSVGFQFLFDQCNQLGAWDMGAVPGALPGHRRVDHAAERRRVEEVWGMVLSHQHGADFCGMLDLMEQGVIGALYVVGEDPLGAAPDGDRVARVLAGLDLLVVQDSFETATTVIADVVLPLATFAEDRGTYTNNEGRVQPVLPFYSTAGEAKRGVESFAEFATALGFEQLATSEQAVFAEICRIVPGYAKFSFEQLGTEGGFSDTGASASESVLFASGLPEQRRIDGFSLITGNGLFHSGHVSERSQILTTITDEVFAELNSVDAFEMGIADDDTISVRGNGHVVEVKAKLRPQFPRRVIFIPDNTRLTGLNNLFESGRYPTPVEVKKSDVLEPSIENA